MKETRSNMKSLELPHNNYWISIFQHSVSCTIWPSRGSNEYPQCMFWIQIEKIRYTPVYPLARFSILSGVKGGIHFTDMFS